MENKEINKNDIPQFCFLKKTLEVLEAGQIDKEVLDEYHLEEFLMGCL